MMILLSFRYRVFFSILLLTLLSLSIVLVPLFWTSSDQYKAQLQSYTSAQARILASMSSAAIVFDQPESASTMLDSLKESPDIVSASLLKYDEFSDSHQLFASYGTEPVPPSSEQLEEQHIFDADYLHSVTPVMVDNNLLGYLRLTVSLTPLKQQLAQLKWGLVLTLLLTLGLASWLALIASRSALRPLDHLKRVTSSIADTKDYSRRASNSSDPDIQGLIQSFNAMLDVIEQINSDQQDKEQEILELNKTLEQKVQSRTAELQRSVQELDQTLQHLKTTQTKLVEREKMASLGCLVAGVAHEINTPVGVAVTAVTHLSFLTSELSHAVESGSISKSMFSKMTAELNETSAIVLKNLERAAEQIRSFKMVAIDQSSEEAREFNLLEYIQNIVLSLRPKLKYTQHQIKLEIDPTIRLYSFPGVYSQIFTNLIMNSLIHGFKDIEAGEVVIQAQQQEGFLQLNYYDNGKGIAKEIKTKIWDPFVTTNRQAGGSGLGTYILYNLITQGLNGRIDLVDDVQQGVHFAMLIPLVNEPAHQRNDL
ncbi:ATP-binding protein [Rheinheimera soli]|uniref:histidine kinase n=1 Tax=Rheinheimera soli TaxID=443616 RepID=A0ABU1VYS5_9GAMM|nr:ATP-binding protein [Rheinheimera soli]MDR7120735.1 signal transduction histidine kinase [Rheinheimera soli]